MRLEGGIGPSWSRPYNNPGWRRNPRGQAGQSPERVIRCIRRRWPWWWLTGLCWAARLSQKAMEPDSRGKRRAWKGYAEKTALAGRMLRLAEEVEG